MQVRLVSKEQVARGIFSFSFESEKLLDYTAGQFIELTLPHSDPDERGIKHWFTLSSAPTESLLSITTKLATKPSTFKKALFSLKPGDEITMSQAMGDFVLPKDRTIPLILVAGGIGVTPVRSILKWLKDTGEQRHIKVIYAARTEEELAFRELIEAGTNNVDYYISRPSKMWAETAKNIQTDDVAKAISASENPLTYLSGPEELVEVLFAELKQKGVNTSRLVTDYFPGYGTI